jgi:hypothetical protein
MGNRVVGRRLRVCRRELFERWGCARAENVAAFVVLEDDHDRMREPRNAGGRRGTQWTCVHHGRGNGNGNDQREDEAHDENASTAADAAMVCARPRATMSPGSYAASGRVGGRRRAAIATAGMAP